MSVAESISKRIKHMPKGKPFAGALFAQAGSRSSVYKTLSRMVLNGLLERVARGVYMRPKHSEYTGKRVRANPISVMEAITRARGEIVQLHGVEAARRLGLSTQMQILPTYYTSGPTREIRMGNAVVRLRHASRQRLQHAGTKVGLVLTALFYLGKQGLTNLTISKIANSLSDEELRTLMACTMPKWMRSALADSVAVDACHDNRDVPLGTVLGAQRSVIG
ncbi:DUF6088 family protein [Pseudomonas putida]|uniref:DUF6088 family protein n=1 Tax=Pseudomonas putida TaxID=303 RepID=UPI001F113F37|nr:DUF6088 family protein [Pseudomonas putida]